MRTFICGVGALVTVLLAGCGQTGALQLPSDPNYDKRAKYLIYKDTDQANVVAPQQTAESMESPVAD